MNHCRKVILLWIVMVGLTLSCREEPGKGELNALSKKERDMPKHMEESKSLDSSGVPLGMDTEFPARYPEPIRFDPENETSEIARKLGVEGDAILRILVNREGGVSKVEIYKSSGHAILDKEAIRIAKKMRFKPVLLREIRVSIWVLFPVRFRFDTRKEQTGS